MMSATDTPTGQRADHQRLPAGSAPAESEGANNTASDAATQDDGDFPFDAPPALPAKQVARISLREQAEDAHRELTRRHRSYAGQVKHGRMTEAEAVAGIAVARAIRNTLRLLADHETAVRETLRRELAAAKLADHPALNALQAEFPDAEITSVRPLYTFTEDQP